MVEPTRSGGTAAVATLARADVQGGMTEVLSALTGRETVGLDDHFFEVLGANSMTMAHFCAKLRKRPGFPAVSMRDVYAHPTVTALSTAVSPAEPTSPVAAAVELEPVTPRGSAAGYVACGIAQALFFVLYSYAFTAAAVPGYTWIATAPDWLSTYLRAVLVGGGLFLAVCLLPVLAKWVLVGRWTVTEFAVWSPAYLRFWVVKALLHVNPMILFVGNPVYVLYLRALGAKIGPGATILSRSIPVCTDLLTIGAGAVIRKDCAFLGYHAQQGRIRTGRVTIGAGALVGEKTVLDLDTEVGAGAQLGHTSSLQSGERVPAEQRWHGCPVVRTEVDYGRIAPRPHPFGLRTAFAVGGLLQLFVITLPLLTGGAYLVVAQVPELGVLLFPAAHSSVLIYLRALTLALLLFAALAVIMVIAVFALPRIAGALVRPDTPYPLYGLHYSLHRSVQALTNRRLLTWLFGDSSYITGYLSRLGYDLGTVEQTGSNFGTEVQHETPYQVSVGGGTMVADGLSIINADYTADSFQVSRTTIGGHSFLGNNIAFPSGGRIGENCLLATKVMVPLDGPVRHGVGLLGSPPFEIPRTVERDARFDHLRSGTALRTALRAKDRFNRRSMIIMSALRFGHLFALSLLGLAVLDFGPGGPVGQLLLAAYAPLSVAFTTTWWVIIERTLRRNRPLQPQLRSIYDPYFWWHERLWKVPDLYLNALNGTPFKNLVWRLLGVRIGARVFDDGAYLTERTLTAIGDDATLNVGSKVQCHSQEDGTFKSDHTSIGAGATLGVGAFIHYGVTIGAGATVTADAFLMKGEEVPERQRWGGNPAAPVTATLGGRA